MRLRNRSRAEGSLSEELIARRLAKARNEIGNYQKYKYILVNDVLDRAVDELSAIVAVERVQHQPAFVGGYTEYAGSETSRAEQVAARCLQSNAKERLLPVLHSFGLEF